MTEATRDHLLSALDLFTPNFLHPTLPPLRVGIYKCMGADTTMLSTPDVLARKDLIHSMIRKAGEEVTEALLKRRCSSHKRLMGHLHVTYHKAAIRRIEVAEWEKVSMVKRRQIALAQLKEMWKDMGVDPDEGTKALLALGGGPFITNSLLEGSVTDTRVTGKRDAGGSFYLRSI